MNKSEKMVKEVGLIIFQKKSWTNNISLYETYQSIKKKKKKNQSIIESTDASNLFA